MYMPKSHKTRLEAYQISSKGASKPLPRVGGRGKHLPARVPKQYSTYPRVLATSGLLAKVANIIAVKLCAKTAPQQQTQSQGKSICIKIIHKPISHIIIYYSNNILPPVSSNKLTQSILSGLTAQSQLYVQKNIIINNRAVPNAQKPTNVKEYKIYKK